MSVVILRWRFERSTPRFVGTCGVFVLLLRCRSGRVFCHVFVLGIVGVRRLSVLWSCSNLLV